MNEAKLTIPFKYKNFEPALELTGSSGRELLDKLPQVLNKLYEMGAHPTGPLAPEKNLESESKPAPTDGPKVCSIHHVTLKKRGKDGQSWYSHKAISPETGVEYWCKGEEAGR